MICAKVELVYRDDGYCTCFRPNCKYMIDHRAIAMDDFYQDVCVEKIASIFLHINDLQPCLYHNNGLTGSVFPFLWQRSVRQGVTTKRF